MKEEYRFWSSRQLMSHASGYSVTIFNMRGHFRELRMKYTTWQVVSTRDGEVEQIGIRTTTLVEGLFDE